jgi:hypothetical protein
MKPFYFAIFFATIVGFTAGAVLANVAPAGEAIEAQVIPYPSPPSTSTPEGDVPSGECRMLGLGASAPVDDPGEDYTLTVFIECGISDSVTRLFEFPLSDDHLWLLEEFIPDTAPDDGVTVH